jgi:hypothetical protein
MSDFETKLRNLVEEIIEWRNINPITNEVRFYETIGGISQHSIYRGKRCYICERVFEYRDTVCIVSFDLRRAYSRTASYEQKLALARKTKYLCRQCYERVISSI